MSNYADFPFSEAGEMACLIKKKKWAQTPLGPMNSWPASLRTMVDAVLANKFPQVICWGEDLTMIYNDAYITLLGEKPDPLGKSFLKVWAELEDTIRPLVNKALAGKSSYFQNMEFTVQRSEEPSQAWFDICYSPIKDDEGKIAGVLHTAVEKTEHIQVAENLKKSERRYSRLFEHIDEGLCIFEVLFDEQNHPVDFRYLEVNPAFERLTGLKDVKGKRRREIGMQLEEEWFRIYGNVALTGQPIRFERAVSEMDKYYVLFAFPFGQPGSNEIAVLFQEISERKKNENRDARLRSIIENSDDAIVSKDLDGIINSWNASAEQMFGYSAAEVIGKPITTIIPKERLDEEEKILEKLKKGKKIDHFETVRKHKDGSLLDVSLTISPLQNADGTIVGASKIARDITERKKIEREREQLLKEVETERERLAEIFWRAPSIMCILKGKNHIIDRANNLFFNHVGDRNIIGQSVRKAFPGIEGQGFFKLLDDVYQTGETYSGNDVQITVEEDGEISEKYFDLVFQPFRNPDESISGVFVQGVDLTKRKQAAEKLKKMNETLEERVKNRTRALRSLASKLSQAEEAERQRLAAELHDNLGQMLTVCKLRLDTLEKDDLSVETIEEVNNISNLTDDALRYTRELMSELKPPPVFDKENLQEVLIWVAKSMETHGLSVTFEDDNKPKPLGKQVEIMVRKAVRELLFNVIKHAETKEAHIILSREGEKVQIVVEDEGRGFDIAENIHLPTEEGGFGLFNIRERVDMLGGSFIIDTEYGRGTRAIITVKAKAKRNNEPHSVNKVPYIGPKNNTSAKQQNKTIKIMLVDDHEMVRKGLRKMIEEQNDLTIIAEAADGKEAVLLALETSPDVIVMDVNMPHMDGIEATKQIITQQPHSRIIGLSLHDNQGVADSIRRAGACAFLTKNEAFESLCKTIREQANKEEI